MAWFHKTLGEMLQAIEEENWQRVKDIADEHTKPTNLDEMHEELTMISTLLNTYSQKMTNVQNIITNIKTKKAKVPTGTAVTILKVSAKEAQDAMFRFEKIIKRLINQGKFEE